MGQPIEVKSELLGNVVVFETNRSVTGQDGESYRSADAATEGVTIAAGLAGRLFAGDSSVDHVHLLSNTVTVRSRNDWSETSVDAAAAIIRDFFVFYEENRGGVATS